MKQPAEISFTNMTADPTLERDIRQRVNRLERAFPTIEAFRVVVVAPERLRAHGALFRVLIHISVHGAELEVGKSRDKHQLHGDIHVAVREAFRTARRLLEEDAHRLHSGSTA